MGDGRAGSAARHPAPALTAAGWAVGLLTTALVVGATPLVPTYRNPQLHTVLDTADTCVALLVGYLLLGRFGRSKRLQDLLLAEALLMLAVAGLGMTLLGLVSDYTPGTVDVWFSVGLRSAAGVLVLLGAMSGDRVVHGWTRRSFVLPWVVVGGAFAILWVLRRQLPLAVVEQPGVGQLPLLAEQPLVFVAWSVAAACFLIASVIFTQQVVRGRGASTDQLLVWAGPAFALAGFARVSYTLVPTLYSGWLYTGDLLRTASYLVLLVGATREIRQYWTAQAEVAVLEDRRRLARELHDGVIQELGYIRIVTDGLRSPPRRHPAGPPGVVRPGPGRGPRRGRRPRPQPRRAAGAGAPPRRPAGGRTLRREPRGRPRPHDHRGLRPPPRPGAHHAGSGVQRHPSRAGRHRPAAPHQRATAGAGSSSPMPERGSTPSPPGTPRPGSG